MVWGPSGEKQVVRAVAFNMETPSTCTTTGFTTPSYVHLRELVEYISCAERFLFEEYPVYVLCILSI